MTEKYGLKQALQAVFKPVRDASFDDLLRRLDQTQEGA